MLCCPCSPRRSPSKFWPGLTVGTSTYEEAEISPFIAGMRTPQAFDNMER